MRSHFAAQKSAFTLAEVLITLGIIGIVAAMTLPGLIQNYQKHVVENQLRATYSILSNAVKWAEVDNGTGFDITVADMSDFNDVNGFSYENSEAVFEKYFKKYFKITQSYPKSDNIKYFKYKGYKGGNYSYPNNGKCYKLANGTGLCFIARGGNQMGYFYIYPKPNRETKIAGRDVFSFEFTRKKGAYKVYQMMQDQYKPAQREQYIEGCTSVNEYAIGSYPRAMICTFLIWQNNFDIPKDYPIKF